MSTKISYSSAELISFAWAPSEYPEFAALTFERDTWCSTCLSGTSNSEFEYSFPEIIVVVLSLPDFVIVANLAWLWEDEESGAPVWLLMSWTVECELLEECLGIHFSIITMGHWESIWPKELHLEQMGETYSKSTGISKNSSFDKANFTVLGSLSEALISIKQRA